MISSKKEDDRNQRPIKEKMRAATRPAPPNRSSTGCVRTQTTQQPAESVAPSSVRTGDSPGRIGFRLLIGERAGRQRTLPRRARLPACLSAHVAASLLARSEMHPTRAIAPAGQRYLPLYGLRFRIVLPVLAELRCGGRASNSPDMAPAGSRSTRPSSQ
jgi:hypothetical protein